MKPMLLAVPDEGQKQIPDHGGITDTSQPYVEGAHHPYHFDEHARRAPEPTVFASSYYATPSEVAKGKRNGSRTTIDTDGLLWDE